MKNTTANFYRFRKRGGPSNLVEYTYFPNVFSAVLRTTYLAFVHSVQIKMREANAATDITAHRDMVQ
jgi:hypothetical protein